MKRIWLSALAAVPLMAQNIDFHFLDQLAEKAKESATINLGPDQLSLLAGVKLGQDKQAEAVSELAKALKAVQVRTFEFDAPGMYDMEGVRAFRDRVKATGGWESVVSVKEKSEFTEILMQRGSDGKPAGFMIIAAEPKELSVIHVVGLTDLSLLNKLGGFAGVPKITSAPKGKSAPPVPPSK